VQEPVTLETLARDFSSHVTECAKETQKTREVLVELASKLSWVDDVKAWWGRFKRWIVSALGAVVLTIVAGTVGSFWNGYQSSQAATKAAQAVTVAAPTPAENEARDKREKAILDQLDAIKKQVSG
jgi:hypothetical protein